MPSPQEQRVLKAQAKSKGGMGKQHDFCEQALTHPSLPSPSSLSQAHSSCLLAGAISASPAPHHQPNLWPAQLLTITGAAARLDLLGCGLRASCLPGPCWVAPDPLLSLPFFHRTANTHWQHSTDTDKTPKKSSGDMHSTVSLYCVFFPKWRFPRTFLKSMTFYRVSILWISSFYFPLLFHNSSKCHRTITAV